MLSHVIAIVFILDKEFVCVYGITYPSIIDGAQGDIQIKQHLSQGAPSVGDQSKGTLNLTDPSAH